MYVSSQNFGDKIAMSSLWEELQLDVFTGGIEETPSWNRKPLVSGDLIDLTEHVKLKITAKDKSTVLRDFK